MPNTARGPDGETIDLKNPWLAAFLAWLVPGLGHFYQGRRAKGLLYFVCIGATFAWGLYMGGGRVVYAQWVPDDQRWQFFCQAGVGLPAIPAYLQSQRQGSTNLALSNDPRIYNSNYSGNIGNYKEVKSELKREKFVDWFMAPPLVWDKQRIQSLPDELDDLHKRYHRYFDLGTLFTMVAGLLNILVIYDAYAGPIWLGPPEGDRKPPDEGKEKKS